MRQGTKLEARRSARAKLAGAVKVTLRLAKGVRIQGKLHELSASGGLVHLEEALPEGSTLMVVFESPAGLVKETAEMLPPHWATRGCLQPFRFTDPCERNQRRLQETLKYLLGNRT